MLLRKKSMEMLRPDTKDSKYWYKMTIKSITILSKNNAADSGQFNKRLCRAPVSISESSTLTYQLKSFERQTPLGGFETLRFPRTTVKMFYEPFIFVVDVVHYDMFPKSDKRSEEHPVDGGSGSSHSELRGFFSSPCGRKSSSKKVMVRFRIKLWYNSGIRQATPFTDDNEVNFIMISL
ncbi:hypothetical protein NECAME_00792 [Necator americanus]|uniref:Uncharacterized protein n=1 Tax=Necator americanus TaxID=51031 RepID=W2SVY2_NECAM|nr:hypothetical protein NECAME_00792 [Necator americanus]ETN73703.1 hypothetical protein NECAME_00792 [Necator americanus]